VSETDADVEFLGPGEFTKLFAEEGVLHEDANARVLVMQERATDLSVVVKVQTKTALRYGSVSGVRQVARRLLGLPEHKHVVKVHRVFEDADFFYTVQEACTGGDLFEYIEQFNHEDLVQFERQLVTVMAEALSGLNHLHKHGLVHNDVKLENFVLSSSAPKSMGRARARLQQTIDRRKALGGEHLTLIDFDLVCEVGTKASRVLGTDGYIAPEAYKFEPCTKSDVFSAGVLMYLIVTGDYPFPDDIFVDTPETNFVGSSTLAEIHDQLVEAHAVVDWDGVWDGLPEARAFCQHLLALRVDDRPTAEEALEHSWIASKQRRVSH